MLGRSRIATQCNARGTAESSKRGANRARSPVATERRAVVSLRTVASFCKRSELDSAPGRIRTCDTWFRKPVLYPLSYGGLLKSTLQLGCLVVLLPPCALMPAGMSAQLLPLSYGGLLKSTLQLGCLVVLLPPCALMPLARVNRLLPCAMEVCLETRIFHRTYVDRWCILWQ